MIDLARWGMGFLEEPAPEDIPTRELVRGLSGLGAIFEPDLIRNVHETYEFRLDGDTYAVTIDNGDVHVSRGPAAEPAAVITTDRVSMLDLAMGRLSNEEAESSGRLIVEGQEAARARIFRLMKLGEHFQPVASDLQPTVAAT